jgi:hypothetical protein
VLARGGKRFGQDVTECWEARTRTDELLPRKAELLASTANRPELAIGLSATRLGASQGSGRVSGKKLAGRAVRTRVNRPLPRTGFGFRASCQSCEGFRRCEELQQVGSVEVAPCGG